MKKRVLSILLLLALMLSASACASVFEAEYSYSAPYSDNVEEEEQASGTEVKNYTQLKNVLSTLVNTLSTQAELRFSNYDGSVSEDMAAACYEVKTQTPMGAYAVESLDYELSRIVSYYTAEVTVEYKRSREEVAQVVTINGISSLEGYLQRAVCSYERELTLKIYSSTVNEEYIGDVVSGVPLSEPLMVTSAPQTLVTAYPSEGINRIYEIVLDYGMDDETIRERSALLTEQVQLLCAPLEEESPGLLALQCARVISGLCQVLPSGPEVDSTAYGALVEHASDSLGMALAYMAMCRQLGLECLTVRGSLGTLGAESHYWNLLCLDGAYYHVDVSRMREAGEENVFLLSDEQAWGTYMWSYEDYPDCAGSLSYYDLVGRPEAETASGNAAGEEAAPETTPPQEEVPAEEENLTGDGDAEKIENNP